MQNDYIMRIIAQCLEALMTILGYKKSGKIEEARELIRATGRTLLKIDVDLLPPWNLDQLLDHFTDYAGRLESERCVLAADLFYELTQLEEEKAALHLKKMSLYLYTAALSKEKRFQRDEKVAFLIEELKDEPLSEKILRSVHSYENSLFLS